MLATALGGFLVFKKNIYARTIKEDDLKGAILQAINELISHREGFMKVLEQNIENKLDNSGKDVVWQSLKYASYCSGLRIQVI